MGIALVVAAMALQLRADSVIRAVTSRSLGTLAPGYAASKRGFSVYVGILVAVGLALLGLGLDTWTSFGIWLFLAAVVLFLLYSIFAIAGEVKTYRALKR